MSALKPRVIILEDFNYLFGKDNRMRIWTASYIVYFALVRHFIYSSCCIGLFTLSMTYPMFLNKIILLGNMNTKN